MRNMAQIGVDSREVEGLMLDCAFPEVERGLNAGRLVILLADLPQTVVGATQCIGGGQGFATVLEAV